jgi:hypothetical protein
MLSKTNCSQNDKTIDGCNSSTEWGIGDFIDVLDTNDVYCPAKILQVDGDKHLITYTGWYYALIINYIYKITFISYLGGKYGIILWINQ